MRSKPTQYTRLPEKGLGKRRWARIVPHLLKKIRREHFDWSGIACCSVWERICHSTKKVWVIWQGRTDIYPVFVLFWSPESSWVELSQSIYDRSQRSGSARCLRSGRWEWPSISPSLAERCIGYFAQSQRNSSWPNLRIYGVNGSYVTSDLRETNSRGRATGCKSK